MRESDCMGGDGTIANITISNTTAKTGMGHNACRVVNLECMASALRGKKPPNTQKNLGTRKNSEGGKKPSID